MDIRIRKRLMALLLAVSMTMGSIPTNAWAEEQEATVSYDETAAAEAKKKEEEAARKAAEEEAARKAAEEEAA